MKRRVKVSAYLMAASTTPLLLAGFRGLLVAMTITCFAVAWVIAAETRRVVLYAILGAGLVAIAVAGDTARTIVVLSVDWVVFCLAVLLLGEVEDAEPRRSLGSNLWVTAGVALAGTGIAFALDEPGLLVIGLAMAAVAAGAFALSLKWLD